MLVCLNNVSIKHVEDVASCEYFFFVVGRGGS